MHIYKSLDPTWGGGHVTPYTCIQEQVHYHVADNACANLAVAVGTAGVQLSTSVKTTDVTLLGQHPVSDAASASKPVICRVTEH